MNFHLFHNKTFWASLVAVVLSVLVITPGYSQTENVTKAERIAFAAFRQGQWDIYSIAPDGSDPRQLTDDTYEDTDPAYSPDGASLVYASRRNNNWDIYLLDLDTGQETRLTTSPHYDGAPTWDPAGKRLAYESYQNGDLDIWLIGTTGQAAPVNLTTESEAGDFGPAWSPDGRFIAFSSWRRENKDLFLFDLETEAISRLTGAPSAEEWPVWHSDGTKLAFVLDDLGDREVFALDSLSSAEVLAVADRPRTITPVTWLGRSDGPAWSPDGQHLAAVFHRWDGDLIALTQPGHPHQLPALITPVIAIQGRLTWRERAINFGDRIATLLNTDSTPLYQEQLTLNEAPGSEPYNLIRMNDVETGTPWLADTVNDSFLAWRFRLREEVSYDFLGELSDALRDLSQASDTTQYASWHKSGRAIDTLFDTHLEGELAHEIVREDYSGNTYWRVLLRCTDQSGTCGRPIVANPWDYSSRARTVISSDQGGIEKANLSGYYVDFTALAREYGWARISSYDDEEYSWTWHFLAFEYWHYEKRALDPAGLKRINWYTAMQDVYSTENLERYFTWEHMRALGDSPHLIASKGVPLPLTMKPWWALVEQ
jgi:TolB protein